MRDELEAERQGHTHLNTSVNKIKKVSFKLLFITFTLFVQFDISITKSEFVVWLAPRAGKMKRILCSDWLPERARWAYLARSGFPALFPQKRNSFGGILY